MEVGRFVPLSKRNDPDESAKHRDVLYEGIPAHLRSSALEFIRRCLIETVDTGISRYRQPRRDILMRIERELEFPLDWSGDLDHAANSLIAEAVADDTFFLDLIDHQLRRLRWSRDQAIVVSLMVALYQAGSAWQVEAVDPATETVGFHLVRRVGETAQAAASQAMGQGKAGLHLRRAWAEVYGTNPDPGKAFSESIKAVEVAAGPVIAPNDSTATLGKMIGQLKGNSEHFKVVLSGDGESRAGAPKGDLDALAIARLMAQLLWTSQHDRHGRFDPGSPIAVSQEEAQAAVHLAVLLVQWFATSVVTVDSA